MRPAEDAANEKLTRTSVSFFGLFFFFLLHLERPDWSLQPITRQI